MRKAKIEVSQVQGDFGDRLEVRQVTKNQKPDVAGKVGNANRLFRKCKRNSEYLRGNGKCPFGGRNEQNRGCGITRCGKLYNLEEETEIAQNELTDLSNWKEVANKDEKENK